MGGEEGENKDLARGWGQQYSWQPDLDTAFKVAREETKPLMLIIHKSWCGACKKLKGIFAEDQEILDLSAKFVMVNAGDDDEPSEEVYKPDGGYIPRILFFKPDGTFLKDIVNTDGNPKFKYYHYSAHSVADCMEDVTLMDLLAPTWENEKSVEEETNLDEKLEEDGGEVESTSREDDASEKDEL